MSTDESLSGHSLPEVVAILSQNGATGRLLINLGSAKAFFYFDKGELAAARMGPLTGLPAVNLAIAMNGTKFQFDPGFEIPSRDFKEAHEISLLNQLLKIRVQEARSDEGETDSPKPLLQDPPRDVAGTVPIPYLFRSTPVESEDLSISSRTTAVQVSPSSPPTGEDSSPSLAASVKPQLSERVETNAANDPRPHSVYLVKQSGIGQASISVRASSTLLLLAVVAVGITALRSKARAPVPSGILSESSARPAATATGGHSSPKEMTSIPVRAKGEAARAPSPKSSPEPKATPEKSPRVKTGKVIDSPSSAVEIRPAVTPNPAPSAAESSLPETPASKLTFRRVPVVIRIENGFVAEAYIKNHQPGLEAFEATALRIARQRRYPKEITGVETIVVQVLTEP